MALADLLSMGALTTEAQLMLATLATLYASSHASLQRPPSAARQRKSDKDDETDQKEVLTAWHAAIMPALAGVVLCGLYYLIMYLDDPDIISKIMQWYLGVMSVGGLFTLYSHVTELLASFCFPRYWKVKRLEPRLPEEQGIPSHSILNVDGSTDEPLPVPAQRWAQNMPGWVRHGLWSLRSIVLNKVNVKFKVPGFDAAEVPVGFCHVVAALATAVTLAGYAKSESTLYSNVIGVAFCYMTPQFISPGTFLTGSLISFALFAYDIVMVFYTPFMVTVATKLDAPIKLQVAQGGRQNILGLGDIVLPGLMVALALRFDLWMHFQRKATYKPLAEPLADLSKSGDGESEGQVLITEGGRHIVNRAKYTDVTGHWGNRFWTGALFTTTTPKSRDAQGKGKDVPHPVAEACFAKPYFYAAMVGYAAAMAVTFVVLQVFKRGQPALLYLVPGVTGSVWLTALVRGELRYMLAYTEDGSLDRDDVVVELDGKGKLVKVVGSEEELNGKTKKRD